MAKTPTQLRSEAACKTVLKNLERRGFEACGFRQSIRAYI